MKKLIIALSVMLSTHYTHTMVRQAKAVPDTKAVPVAYAVELSHQPYNNVPVATVARPYNPKIDPKYATAIAEDINDPKYTNATVRDLSEPIVIYNAKGEKVSEHLINDDGSEHHIVYDLNGDIITTILDHNKIKQQVTLLKPDKSSIIKHYDKKGKQVSVETINATGEKVHTFNSSQGDLIASEIYNKSNELEGSTFVDDWGNRTTSIHNPDGTTTSSLSSIAEITHEEDGSTRETSYDSYGNKILIGRNSDGKIIYRTISNPNGPDTFFDYDPTTGTIISKIIVIGNPDGSSTTITYDPITDKIIDKFKETENADGSSTTITYDPETDKITGKRVSIINSDGSSINKFYDLVTDKINYEQITDADGNLTTISYDSNGIATTH